MEEATNLPGPPTDFVDVDPPDATPTPFDQLPPPTPVQPPTMPPPSEAEIGAAVETMNALGFTVSRAEMERRFEDARQADHPLASTRTIMGLPFSAGEVEELDRRTDVVNRSIRDLADLRSLASYAGEYLNVRHEGGRASLEFAFADESDLAEAHRVIGAAGFAAEVSVKKVAESLHQLRKMRDEAEAEMTSMSATRTGWRVSIDPDLNSVILTHTPELADQARRVAAAHGLVTELAPAMVDEVGCSESGRCLPLSAGTDFGGCTAGPLVQLGSNRGVLTAGHCAGSRPTVAWSGITATRFFYIDTTHTDIAVYDVPDTVAGNDLYASDSSVNRFGIQISQARDAVQSEFVCKHGRRSHYTCGTVTRAIAGEQAQANYLSCPGDSGSAIFVATGTPQRRVAVGVHDWGIQGQNGCPSPIPSGTRGFTQMTQAQRGGWTVVTASQVRRDFVISMYDRALGRIPDAGGLSGWSSGTCNFSSLGGVVRGFYLSNEFINQIATLDDVRNDVEIRNRFSRLYRGVLRRGASLSELESWRDWVWNRAASVYGSNSDAANEAAFSDAVWFFSTSPEFQQRFSSGYDGEIPLCLS